MSFQLRIVSGPKAGHVVPAPPGSTLTIGRGADASVPIPEDNTLSRAHAEVVDQGGKWVLVNKSQHGSFMNGEVFQDQRPLAPGTEFQVGGTKLVFEAAGAGAPAGAAAGGAAAGGGGGGFDAAGAGAAGSAAAGAAGAAAADALKSLPSGPVTIDASGDGWPIGDIIKGGLGIFKANKMPSFVLFWPYGLFAILQVVMQILVQVHVNVGMGDIGGTIIGILGMVMLAMMGIAGLWGLAMPLLVANYVNAVKEYQKTGTPFGIGALFSFDDIVPKYVIQIVTGIAFQCCFIPGFLIAFALPLYLDKPEVGIGGAFKGSLAFVKRNIVPWLLLMIVMGVVNTLGAMCCGAGLMITMPAMTCALWLAYESKRDQFAAAMAEDGVTG